MTKAAPHSKRSPIKLLFFTLLLAPAAFAQNEVPNGQLSPANSPVVWSDQQKARMAERVREDFLHAWEGYRQYAWGHDELKPLSRGYRDWYSTPASKQSPRQTQKQRLPKTPIHAARDGGPGSVSLLMTPVDALDTMLLMGLKDEAKKDRRLIDKRLSFDKDIYVKNFEVTIRLLGGLLSSYELTGDKRLLALANDLGMRLLPAFNSPTGMPYVFVNLRTGMVRGAESNPAEIGSLLIEFGTLSKLTGNPIYYEKAKHALVEVYHRRSPIGLVGSSINVETGKWTDPVSHISGGIDSYYEYLLKSWLLFGDPDCERMWKTSIAAVNKYLADPTPDGLWYAQVNMYTGQRVSTDYGALDAFFPGELALSGDLQRAEELQDSSYKMWTNFGVEPEEIDYSTMKIVEPGYELRPEIIESTYYLYYFTGEPRYLDMGKTYLDSLEKYCRTDAGFAALANVVTKQKRDAMESFFLAETLKYLYLLYAPKSTLDLDKAVFNTEAHPMQKRFSQPALSGKRKR
ncbi:MAG TPA: glycoside hydrolase family 47 protein [Terriglobales bacterium]|nr:glycoside hydrolase family 47 protein [Terriglobales bacterium]